MKRNNFRESLHYGEEGEKEMVEILRNYGYNVRALYETNPTEAPRIIIGGISLALPDIFVKIGDKKFCIESKRKEDWFYNKYRDIYENGIDIEKRRDYVTIAEEFGIKIYVSFLMKDGIYIIDVEKNGRECWGKRDGIDHWNSYNWNKKDFRRINI